jgi:predicted RNA-binding protein associated with RNAse of E/G family
MVQRPGDHHAVWHFWTGPDREFACWYVNLQTAFVRTSVGYDTQDLELDIVVTPDGTWTLKDLDVLDDRVAEGRFSPELARWIVSLGEQLAAELDA